MQDHDEADEELAALEAAMAGAGSVTAAFEAELRRMSTAAAGASGEVNVLSGGISSTLKGAFEGLVFEGMKLSDALTEVARSMVDAAYSAAVRPVTSHVGGMLSEGLENMMTGLLPFAKGAGFAEGRVMPFARGGVVSGPSMFPMRGGWGLMGEAGPEAILPLGRGADGRLGVQLQGGGRPVNVVMNITTPDAEGFRRSQSQIAAQMGRMMARGQRNR